MAEALAASCPSYLVHPTIPPISWAQNGEMITVILADGWKVSASIQAIKRVLLALESDQEPDPETRVVNEIVPLWQESLFVLVKVSGL